MSTPDAGRHRLSGSLGVGAIVMMVVAAAAPLTVVAGTVPLGLTLGNGPAYPATFAVSCVVLLLFAVGFCTMSRHVGDAGAFYSYVVRGLGRVPGLGTAFLALATYTAIQLAVLGYIGASLDELVRHWGGPALPWWLWALAVVVVIGLLGHRHIELSGRVLGVLLVAEVAIVLALDVVVVGRAEQLSSALVTPSAFVSGSLGVALMFAVASFIGFEATAVFRDEARDPDRTVPRATYTALLIIGVFYTLSGWAVVSAWGDDAAVAAATESPGTMVVTTITDQLGRVGGEIAQVLLVTSLFAAALSFHNVLARYYFTLGNSGALPVPLGRSHRTHASPYVASLLHTVVALVLVAVFALAGLDPVVEVFGWMSGTATLGVLALMTMTCSAVLVFFRRTRADTRVWQTLVAPGLGLLGLVTVLTTTVLNFPTLIGGSGVLALAIGAVLAGAFLAGVVRATVSASFAPDPGKPAREHREPV